MKCQLEWINIKSWGGYQKSWLGKMILRYQIYFSPDRQVTKFFFWIYPILINLILLELSQVDVCLKLAQQDAFDLQRVGMSVSTEKGPSAMIYEGLELEESQ